MGIGLTAWRGGEEVMREDPGEMMHRKIRKIGKNHFLILLIFL